MNLMSQWDPIRFKRFGREIIGNFDKNHQEKQQTRKMFNSSNTKRIKIEAANATLVEGHHEDHNGENLVKKSGSNFYNSKSL